MTSNAILRWCYEHKVERHYIAPSKPMQNGFVESVNGRMRDELLNEIYGDINGDRKADFAVLLSAGINLIAADFLL